MSNTMEQHPVIDLNLVLKVTKDGTVLFSNNVNEPLLQEWGVRVGEKVPSLIEDIVQSVISRNSPEKMEVKAGNIVFLVVFSPLPEQECVYISGFDISDQNEIEKRLIEAYEEIQTQSEELHVSNEELKAQSGELQNAHKLLHEREKEVRKLVENSPDLIARFDSQNHCLYANSAFMRFYDIPPIAKFYGWPASKYVDRTKVKLQIDPQLVKLSEEKRAKVIATGEPESLEFRYTSSQGEIYYFDTKIVPEFVDSKVTSVLVVSRDITERRKAEEVLNKSEERQAFLLKLSDALHPLSDAIEIQATITRIVMEYYGSDRCYYCEFEGDNAIIRQDASRDDLPSVAGVYSLSSLPIFKAVVDAGGPIVVSDSNTTELMDEELRQLCIQMKIISYINVPVIKGGKPVGNICITQCTPRNWTDLEEELAVEIAERTWAAVERACIEDALRLSKSQLSADLVGLRRLYELNSKLSNETDLRVALDEILAVATEFTGAERGTVQLISDDCERLEIVAYRGYSHGNRFIEHFKNEGSETACDVARRQRKRLIIEDVENFPPLAGTKDQEVALAEGIRATQSTPMINQKGETIGVLSTQFSRPNHPRDHELKLIDLLAWTSANFIERHFSDKALVENEKRFKLLSDTNALLLSSKDPEKVIQIIAEKVMVYLNCDLFFNYVFDKSYGMLHLNAYAGINAEANKEVEWLDEGSAICGCVALEGYRIISEDIQNNGDKRADLVRSMGIQAYACQPLRIGENILGTLSFGKRNSKNFTDDELTLMSTVADQVSIAIERSHIEEALKKSNETLEERVRERTAELEKAYKSLKEVETVRKQEIHHRIKNNLQVISSLLDLQAEKFSGKQDIKDSQVLEAFKESQDRVVSMALIHEELHKGRQIDTLNFSHYVEQLAENLLLTYRVGNDGVNLYTGIDVDIFFDMDTAVPLGIIINELVSNSLKHAFPDRDNGEIYINLCTEEVRENKTERSKSKTLTLSISDNGVGISEDLDIEDLDSLGLQLVTTLVEQLDGKLELQRDNGTEFVIRFSITENKNQIQSSIPQLLDND